LFLHLVECFSRFKDQSGRFSENLHEDVRGLLSLYEASQLSCEHLRAKISRVDQRMSRQVQRALQVPLYRRVRRVEAREYIETFERTDRRSQVLLEFTMLNFNMVQTIHQRELRELSGVVEGVVLGVSYLMAAIEDIFGEHQSVEELERLVQVVERELLSAQQQQQQTALSCSFMNVDLNIARVSKCMYDYEDGVGVWSMSLWTVSTLSLPSPSRLPKVEEEQARQHIRNLLRDAWRRLNRELLSAQQQQQQIAFSRSFMNVTLNIVKVSQCMYDYEDGVSVLKHEPMD
ncbi:Alpha-terpineol synthase, partial [Nymphaea thermarum]